MSQPSTPLYQQKYLGMVNLNIRVFYFKVVKEKIPKHSHTPAFYTTISRLHQTYINLLLDLFDKPDYWAVCNENKYIADRNLQLGP